MPISSIESIPASVCRNLQFFFTDIDDTITLDGKLPFYSLQALWRLSEQGVLVVPVTGRPAGWCDYFARMWPVAGVIGENGAFYFCYDRARRKMIQVYAKTEPERLRDRVRLSEVRERIRREVPGAGIASDQDCRVADLAIDFCEDVDPLSGAEVNRIVQIFEDEGCTAKVSSIHVNGWFGAHDKLTMTRSCLSDLFDIDAGRDSEQIAFIGDSPNDAPMFEFFSNSVGVANVSDFKLPAQPKWVASKRSSEGFIEFAELLLGARGL